MSHDLFEASFWFEVIWKTLFLFGCFSFLQTFLRYMTKSVKVSRGMTKNEAAAEYDRIADELERLHRSASSYISRRDNNWQFEVYHSMRYVADRIRKEYDVGEYKGGGCHSSYEPKEDP